ncbi:MULTISPECIES: hypothetical protein [Erysipelothrix]|uniref:hypothetical protein n=1 Tax=Erysipelothrix TaxID=1647 RepID=UPI001376B9B2|nr:MULTISPECIES: hypothetical protein [unclassified Erysipelothrix]MBK2402134.1 hypothetical protein [Erysipelothrix sp. strain 2 (EsS2-6-Brazil)]MBK2404554.1 hypothetical protein [Erysipelothrix sp. strain 2 (EsS2-7-Brazil)]NBA01170.1 hypothetical protein [Erysipelothrix rhusiopathiae]
MKKIKESLSLYAPIYIIIAIGLGWLVFSRTGNFFFITTYLLDIAIIMSGVGVYKYNRESLSHFETPVLSKEVRFLGVFLLCLFGISIFLFLTHRLELAYLITVSLLVAVGTLDFTLKYKELRNRTK